MKPFKIEVPDADLERLRQRIAEARWPVGMPEVGWGRGIPQDYLRELAEYWRTEFDWRAVEARLNSVPQFTTTLDGANVHFLHVRSPEPDAVPVIITHGWPGSVVEFLDVIGPLTDPRAHGADPADAFSVVIPSMPGFGFSGPAGGGWNTVRVAEAWDELMRQLGYDHYIAQGGDFGAGVAIVLGMRYPERVTGVHVNTMLTKPRSEEDLVGITPDEQARLDWTDRFVSDLSGSMKLMSTRPHTVSYAVNDSAVGQLAWVVEKFKDWADAPTAPEDAVDRDLMLGIATIYWLTGTAGSSAQFYREIVDRLPISEAGGHLPPMPVPVGVATFPHGPFKPVRRFAERDMGSIVHWSEFDHGGHFAAMEEPDLFAADLRAFGRLLKRY